MRALTLVGRIARQNIWCGRLVQLALLRGPIRVRGVEVATFKDGRRMELEVSDRTQATMFCGTHEPVETERLRGILTAGDSFVDVGAHVGWFTLLAARIVGPTGSVFAFEPYPPNLATLTENIARNHLASVSVIEAGVGASSGHAKVGRQLGSDSGSSTIGSGSLGDGFDVPVVTLDSTIPQSINPTLLKVDAEGLEEQVLRGGMNVLSRTRSVLIEINASALARNESSEDAVLGCLADTGFTTFETLPSGRPFARSQAGQANVLARR